MNLVSCMKKGGIPLAITCQSFLPYALKSLPPLFFFFPDCFLTIQTQRGPLSSSGIDTDTFRRPISKRKWPGGRRPSVLEGRSQLASQARVVPKKIGMFTWPLGLYGWDEGYHRIRRNTDFQLCKPALQGWVHGPRSLGVAGHSEAYSFVLGCTDDS